MKKITLKCNSYLEDSLDTAMEHFKGKTKLHIRSLQQKYTIDHSDSGY
jgi:hypothetical protein